MQEGVVKSIFLIRMVPSILCKLRTISFPGPLFIFVAILDSITQDFIEGNAEPVELDWHIRELVKQLYLELCNPAFYDAITTPTTEWDQFIQKAMGDNPYSLVAFLNQELNFDPFPAFLLAVRTELSPQQFISLRDWYQASAQSLSGETIWWPSAN